MFVLCVFTITLQVSKFCRYDSVGADGILRHASAKTAMSALDDLEESLDKLNDILEKYSGNSTIEAMFKNVNEQFVEKTVKPTYRALADNDLKLVNALKKITW